MGLEVLANKTGFKVEEINFDSTAFQFWASEQYEKGIALSADNSYDKNPDKSIFTKEQILDFELKARELNKNKQGDAISVYLRKK